MYFANASATSGSADGKSWLRQTIVTLTPIRANICESSAPTKPPPITSSDFGSVSSASAEVLVR